MTNIGRETRRRRRRNNGSGILSSRSSSAGRRSSVSWCSSTRSDSSSNTGSVGSRRFQCGWSLREERTVHGDFAFHDRLRSMFRTWASFFFSDTPTSSSFSQNFLPPLPKSLPPPRPPWEKILATPLGTSSRTSGETFHLLAHKVHIETYRIGRGARRHRWKRSFGML